MRRATALGAAALAVGLLAVTGCSAGSSGGAASPAGSSASAPGAVGGEVVVLAAASLRESFTTIARQFEAAHPGTKVTLSFAGSSQLAEQIASGSPADVFASASTATMAKVVDAGSAASPTVFATNTMEIAVPPSNPGHVSSLADLAKAGVTVAVCQEQVPCGAAATKVFANAGLTVAPSTLEPDVKAVLSKVTIGEVDAGVVYVTDVKAAGEEVLGVPIAADVNAATSYPAAVLTKAPNPATASAFVTYLASADGQAVLAAAGFGKP